VTRTAQLQQGIATDEMGFKGPLQSSNPELRMSAVGQKRTLRHMEPMSAIPPKADIGTQPWNVRLVPEADILRCGKNAVIRSPRRRDQAMTAGL
jgi:hypothetical protein